MRSPPAGTVLRTGALAPVGQAARIKRRGGSEPLRAPAPIPPSLMLHDTAALTAGAVWVFTPERISDAG